MGDGSGVESLRYWSRGTGEIGRTGRTGDSGHDGLRDLDVMLRQCDNFVSVKAERESQIV